MSEYVSVDTTRRLAGIIVSMPLDWAFKRLKSEGVRVRVCKIDGVPHRAVETLPPFVNVVIEGGIIIELTRHGKRVAVVQAASAAKSPLDLASWIGSGKGSVSYGPNYDPAAPAWDWQDWES